MNKEKTKEALDALGVLRSCVDIISAALTAQENSFLEHYNQGVSDTKKAISNKIEEMALYFDKWECYSGKYSSSSARESVTPEELGEIITELDVEPNSALTAPDVNEELLECLNDAINLWDAQNPHNPDDINKWREVAKQSKANIEYVADAIVKAIADILYLANTYEKIGKFKGTIDELTIVLNRLGFNEDDNCAEQKGQSHE